MTSLFPQPAPAAQAALRDIRSEKAKVRCAAAEALGDVGDQGIADEARAALIRATTDLQPEVRATAAFSLGELGGADAVQALIGRLVDGNSAVRQAAAVALGTIGDSAAVPALLRALDRGPADLRFQVVTTLAELDAVAARAPLMAALDDDDAEVVGAAALALGATGAGEAREAIASRLPEHGPKTAFDLAYALADLGDQRAVAVLADYTGDGGYGWDAVVALEKLGDAATATLLGAAANRKAPANVRLRAAAAVLDIDPTHDSARAQLLRALRSRKLEERGLAVESLAAVGGLWALEELKALSRRWAGRRLREEIEAAVVAIEERVAT